MSTSVSNAPPVGGLENTRKAQWAQLNRMMENHYCDNPMAFRHVVILSKLYFAPEAKAVHVPTQWTEDGGRYHIQDRDEGYNPILQPYDEGRLVCDNGFERHERWNTLSFWLRATDALGLRRTDQNIDELATKGVTYWARGHQRNVYVAAPITRDMANLVNSMGMETGSHSPWTVNSSLEIVQSPKYKAKEGDWIASHKMQGPGLYNPIDLPYNGAKIFNAAFFKERARYIDDLT